MGKTVEDPRYNILSCRVTDDVKDTVHKLSCGLPVSNFVLEAIQEKIERSNNGKADKTK